MAGNLKTHCRTTAGQLAHFSWLCVYLDVVRQIPYKLHTSRKHNQFPNYDQSAITHTNRSPTLFSYSVND